MAKKENRTRKPFFLHSVKMLFINEKRILYTVGCCVESVTNGYPLSHLYLISKISKQAFSYSVRFLTIHINQIQQSYLTLVFLHNTNVCKKVMITNA